MLKIKTVGVNINDKFANQALIAGYNYILQTVFYQNPLLLTNDNVPFERWDMQESYFGESDLVRISNHYPVLSNLQSYNDLDELDGIL